MIVVALLFQLDWIRQDLSLFLVHLRTKINKRMVSMLLKYDETMDFVVFVRIHHLDKNQLVVVVLDVVYLDLYHYVHYRSNHFHSKTINQSI